MIDWAAYREARKPTASCQKCRQLLPLDAFEHKQWEHVRANNLASCMTCWQGKPPSHRRRLEPDSLQKYKCCGCNTMKIADCLKCLQVKRAEGLQCRKCLMTKKPAKFTPAMATMPAAGILCIGCQDAVKKQVNRQWKGFFTCQVCRQIFPSAVGTGKDQKRTCSSCSSREIDKRGKGLQTCRNKGCKRKFADGGSKDGKRQRYCPECRVH